MKALLRNYLVNLGALWIVTQIIPSLQILGGAEGLMLGALTLMGANILLVPLLKILLLPLNLLTLGIFAWLSNVLALYFLTILLPYISISAYHFPGLTYQGFTIPAIDLPAFYVVVIASFLIGFIIHLTKWLIK